MNKEIKAKWVAALRSGKYQQGQGLLRSEDRFCCLGVLCDLKDEGDWVEPDEEDEEDAYANAYSFNGSEDLPGRLVMDWAGFPPRAEPASIHRIPSVTIDGTECQLHDHNDNGRTFAEIADAIEAQL